MRKIGEKWLSCWLYIMMGISGILLGITFCKWSAWTLQDKIFAFATALLPLHVLEEWYFPGGFHTMYNLMAKSDCPDRYPMNQMSDMWTNLIGVIFGCLVLAVGVSPFFCVMQLFLCCAEIFGHFSGGVFLKKMFSEQGKRTIYSPGMFTTVWGYIPVAIGMIVSFFTNEAPSLFTFLFAVVCGVVLGALSLNVPEKLLRSKDTLYGFTWGDGYLSKYLDG